MITWNYNTTANILLIIERDTSVVTIIITSQPEKPFKLVCKGGVLERDWMNFDLFC